MQRLRLLLILLALAAVAAVLALVDPRNDEAEALTGQSAQSSS
ncbi:MAG: hypothetical protein ACKVT1_07195 [Dehalococcoidia bacterium]